MKLELMSFVAVVSLPDLFPGGLSGLIRVWTRLFRVTVLLNTDEKQPLCRLVSASGLSVLGSNMERVRDTLPRKLPDLPGGT